MGRLITIIGSGWLGIPLAKRLLANDFEVVATTTQDQKLNELKSIGVLPVKWRLGEKLLKPVLDSDIVIVAITSKEVFSYRSLIQQLVNSKVNKIIYISSTAVYDANDAVVTEETPTNNHPMAEIERLFLKHLPVTTILRFAGLFGETRKPGNFFKSKPSIPNPYGVVNMIHLEDCLQVIEAIIEQEKWGEIYNACSPHHPTREEFYIAARRVLAYPEPVFSDSSGKNKEIDCAKLVNDLNYKFVHHDIIEALKQ